jgi:hypothetical protein
MYNYGFLHSNLKVFREEMGRQKAVNRKAGSIPGI